MIYRDLPHDWKDLQNRVARILDEIGFEVVTGKIVPTARGEKEIDVYAIDRTQAPTLTYLCECKNWESRVPQEVVHSFRTVVHDHGANYGLIISRHGFQSGAYQAAQFTNIQLLSWDQFQQLFLDRWIASIGGKLYEVGMALSDYTEPINSGVQRQFEKLGEETQRKIRQLQSSYSTLALMTNPLMLSMQMSKGFPQTLRVPSSAEGTLEAIAIYSGRELVDLLMEHCTQGTEKFDLLFGEHKYRWNA